MRENGKPTLKRVLLAGEKPVKSAPTLALAAELDRMGIANEFSMGAERTDTWRWIKQVRRSDVVVLVHYNEADMFLQRQFHLARLMGCTVVRWWVGTDVLLNLKDPSLAESTRALDRVVDVNIAVAPHLVEELAGIGIEAAYVPSVCALPERPTDLEQPPPRGILTYLPTERRAFYGQKALAAAIKANPDLEFIIVSDEAHTFGRYDNVRSLGWVEDMEQVWPRVGALLRVTEHDGLPRMVLEALARGRYVIYSWPMDGCWFARSPEQVLEQLTRFKSLTAGNAAGIEQAHQVAANAGQRFVQAVTSQRWRLPLVRRGAALLQAVRCGRSVAQTERTSSAATA